MPRGPPPGKRKPLRRDQCAYCKERGHWKSECPHLLKKRTKAAGPPGHYQPQPPGTNLTSPAGAGPHQGEPGSLQLEPPVRIRVGGQAKDFMVDGSTEHSVVTQQLAPFSGKEITDIRATGTQTHRPFYGPQQCQLGAHESPYPPDCPAPLTGNQISFSADGSSQLQSAGRPSSLTMTPAEESVILTELEAEYPLVWAEGNPPGLAKNHAPIVIDLKPGARPVKLPPCCIPPEALLGIQTQVDRWRQHGILVKCQSPWNAPLKLVKKPGTQEYRPLLVLKAINKVVFPLPSAVPDKFALLSRIPSTATWFTYLDLKDAAFCLRVAPVSQPLFAFQWENPHTGTKEQLTWTRLPQGFKNTLTLLSRALADDLAGFPAQELNCVLLQYVDDLLLASSTQAQCLEGTKALLSLLTEAGYRVSKKKAQICQRQVRYLGIDITQGQQFEAVLPQGHLDLCEE
uniref:Reverse transcriptase domain-containing protein n=1 Tax=Spermophilus dauricus TaxID=99837 RepID=A0A8C9QLR3_SPEDA